MIEDEQQREHPPKQTLYIQNINEKIKSKDVKYVLFNLFESFGQVVQIICKRNDRMRGQAFIVFREVGQATSARNNLNGYPIFDLCRKFISQPSAVRLSLLENNDVCNVFYQYHQQINSLLFK